MATRRAMATPNPPTPWLFMAQRWQTEFVQGALDAPPHGVAADVLQVVETTELCADDGTSKGEGWVREQHMG